MAISDLVRDIRNNSTNFINYKKFVNSKFAWQEGYRAFSYGHSPIEDVYNYILHQEVQYQTRTFREKYLDFLEKFEIPFEERYLFEFHDSFIPPRQGNYLGVLLLL